MSNSAGPGLSNQKSNPKQKLCGRFLILSETNRIRRGLSSLMCVAYSLKDLIVKGKNVLSLASSCQLGSSLFNLRFNALPDAVLERAKIIQGKQTTSRPILVISPSIVDRSFDAKPKTSVKLILARLRVLVIIENSEHIADDVVQNNMASLFTAYLVPSIRLILSVAM